MLVTSVGPQHTLMLYACYMPVLGNVTLASILKDEEILRSYLTDQFALAPDTVGLLLYGNVDYSKVSEC